MMRTPSINTLRAVFGDKAPAAKAILCMTRRELLATDAGTARNRECYNPPKTYDLRMHCLDALGETYGVESCESVGGEYVDYLSTGDCYADTLIRWRGNYRVQSLGDFIERSRVAFR